MTWHDNPRYFTNAAGERLAFITAGDPANPPVILIHGWTSFMGVWEGVLPALAEHYYVVSPDLLGHGRSAAPHQADYGILAQGRRMLALADMLGLARFALVGHSMGGQVALGVASQLAPGRVNALVSIAGVVTGALTPRARFTHQLYRFGRYIAFAAPVVRPLLRYAPVANLLYGRTWFYDMHSLPRRTWQGQAAWVMRRKTITPLWKAGNAIIAGDMSSHLAQITAPVLVIFGREDATVDRGELEPMQVHIPSLEAHLYENCGHFPMFERPTQCREDLMAFLAACH